MKLRRVLASMLLCALAACGKTADDRVTREQWSSPSGAPAYQKLPMDQRVAFTHYRNHIVRLNYGKVDGLPTDITWSEAVERGRALRAREAEAGQLLRATLADERVRVADVTIGRSNAVCGRIVFPALSRRGYDRPFIVLPGNDVVVGPAQAEFDDDERAAVERMQGVRAMLQECEPDASALKRSSSAGNVVASLERVADGPAKPPARPSIDAIRAAEAAGERADRNALREIIEQQSDMLFDVYVRSFNNHGGRVTPELEGILLLAAEQGNKPAAWPLLLPAWPRCTARYATPAMRAALFDLAKSSSHDLGVAQFLCGAFDADRDAVGLLAVVRSQDAAGTLIRYVQVRKPAGAVPPLLEAYSVLASKRESVRTAALVYVALLSIGSEESLAAFRERVAALSARRDELAAIEAANLLFELTQTSSHARVDTGTILPLWAAFPQRDTRSAFASWASFWSVKDAAPLLLRSLEETGDTTFASAVLRIGGPAEWKKVDAWSRGPGSGRPVGADLRKEIDRAIDDPARASAEQAARERQSAYWHATRDDSYEEDVAKAARTGDPAAHVKWQRSRLDRNVAASREFADLPAAVDLARRLPADYADLAGYARWTARDPAGAIALYETASRMSRKDAATLGFDPFDLAIADTMRFDLRDPQGATARLRALRDGADPRWAAALGPWIDAEIASMTGTRVALPPDHPFCAAASFWLRGGGFPGVRDEPVQGPGFPARDNDARIAEALDGLTPSLFHLYASFNRWPALGTPERIVQFGKRHDPSGISLACAMRLVQLFAHFREEHPDERDRSRNLPPWSDTDFAAMTRASFAVVGAPPDLPRANAALATPAGTWSVFIAALRRGDLAAARECMTSEARGKIDPLLAAMSKDQLRAVGDSFTRFELSSGGESVRDALVTRNGRNGIVSFIKQGKEWRIADM